MNNKLKHEEIISIGFPDRIKVFTTEILFKEFGIVLEFIKRFKDDKDYITLVFQENNGFLRFTLEHGEKLGSNDVMYYLNEIIEQVRWCNWQKELIQELIYLWSQTNIFLSTRQSERTVKQNIAYIGIKAIYSIIKISFEIVNLNKVNNANNVTYYVIDEIMDSIGRKQKVKFFNYTA